MAAMDKSLLPDCKMARSLCWVNLGPLTMLRGSELEKYGVSNLWGFEEKKECVGKQFRDARTGVMWSHFIILVLQQMGMGEGSLFSLR